MLIGWIVARRDIRRRLAALRRPVEQLALPSARFGHVIDRDGRSFECAPRLRHSDVTDGKQSASVVSCAKRPLNNAIGPERALSIVVF